MLVPDNLKAAVVMTDRYESAANHTFEEMANHYATMVVPARPVHPKDNPNAVGLVKIIYTRIYAKLRHRFYCLKELNKDVMEFVIAHN